MADQDEYFRTSTRLGLHSHFLDIAYQSYYAYQERITELNEYLAEGGFEYMEGDMPHYFDYKQDEIFQTRDKIAEESIKTVVFLAMFCEAYIWDLAASILGDNYAKKHLDKLDTLSKWVVLPKLLFGTEIDPGHHALGQLKTLIKFRNELVHSKSRDASSIRYEAEKFLKELKPAEEQIPVKELFSGIRDLFVELERIDKGNYHQFYFKRAI